MDISVDCATCVTGLDHCHGTLIEHLDGLIECTEQQCALSDPVRHEWFATCDTIHGGCDCVPFRTEEPLQAAS